MTKKRDYGVGKGKPPKASRFKKGHSGNRRGRPKGSRNFATDLDDVLGAKTPVTESGKRKNVTTQQAALMRLREKALKGDPRALDRIITLAAERSEECAARDAERRLTKNEEEILDRFRLDVLREAGARTEDPGAELRDE